MLLETLLKINIYHHTMLRLHLTGLITLVKHPPNLFSPTSCRFMSSMNNKNNGNKASLAQLVELELKLTHHLPYFFTRPHYLGIYTKDVVFVDNIRNVRTQGLNSYALQIYLIKFYYALRYSSVKLELLNLVKHPDESYLRVRWRIIKRPGVIFTYINSFKIATGPSKNFDRWKDGISTFHVNNQGKIYCHICDNIDVGTDDLGNEANIVRAM